MDCAKRDPVEDAYIEVKYRLKILLNVTSIDYKGEEFSFEEVKNYYFKEKDEAERKIKGLIKNKSEFKERECEEIKITKYEIFKIKLVERGNGDGNI